MKGERRHYIRTQTWSRNPTVSIERRNFPQFFITAPSPCPYLDGKVERKVFTHLVGQDARSLNTQLSQGGFRRSQNIAYRPACEGCAACVSVRVPVNTFVPGRASGATCGQIQTSKAWWSDLWRHVNITVSSEPISTNDMATAAWPT